MGVRVLQEVNHPPWHRDLQVNLWGYSGGDGWHKTWGWGVLPPVLGRRGTGWPHTSFRGQAPPTTPGHKDVSPWPRLQSRNWWHGKDSSSQVNAKNQRERFLPTPQDPDKTRPPWASFSVPLTGRSSLLSFPRPPSPYPPTTTTIPHNKPAVASCLPESMTQMSRDLGLLASHSSSRPCHVVRNF